MMVQLWPKVTGRASRIKGQCFRELHLGCFRQAGPPKPVQNCSINLNRPLSLSMNVKVVSRNEAVHCPKPTVFPVVEKDFYRHSHRKKKGLIFFVHEEEFPSSHTGTLK